jgi:hypothetical protein
MEAAGEYIVYKGVGKTVEFLGLKSQYLIGFCVGVLSVFILFIMLRVAGISLAINVVAVAASLGGLVRYVFSFNKKYGQHGLMKKNARGRCPRFVTSRKSFYRMYSVKCKM